MLLISLNACIYVAISQDVCIPYDIRDLFFQLNTKCNFKTQNLRLSLGLKAWLSFGKQAVTQPAAVSQSPLLLAQRFSSSSICCLFRNNLISETSCIALHYHNLGVQRALNNNRL